MITNIDDFMFKGNALAHQPTAKELEAGRTKYCKDCKYIKREDGRQFAICDSPFAPRDPVEGEKYVPCFDMRNPPDHIGFNSALVCGSDGKWFSLKENL